MKKTSEVKSYSKDLHSDSSGLNCTTYDLTHSIADNKKNNCVGIGIPSSMNNNNSDENLASESAVVDEKRLCECFRKFSLCLFEEKSF